ncbi:MAG TPA: fibronectin type III domain-containing protein [Candidatus Krumholzibacterium sp.]|nr:fibronectin type III domain-containing protein [Candidatus Krumholzibacterium sp.]
MKRIASIILSISVMVLLSCSDELGDSPAAFSFEAPEAPDGLEITPGPNQLVLEWTYPGDPAEVSGYIVYYDYEAYGVQEVIDTVSTTTYTDDGLIGNMIYCYKVSALNLDRIEGRRSGTECGTAGD